MAYIGKGPGKQSLSELSCLKPENFNNISTDFYNQFVKVELKTFDGDQDSLKGQKLTYFKNFEVFCTQRNLDFKADNESKLVDYIKWRKENFEGKNVVKDLEKACKNIKILIQW